MVDSLRGDTIVEEWRRIPEFSNYEISNLGNVYNRQKDRDMRTSINNFGHVKISLTTERKYLDEETGEIRYEQVRYTRSVAQLVAEAFVERPDASCDQVVVLDGNFANVAAYNLAWRPHWFAWKYTRQLKLVQPLHYRNLPVINVTKGIEYDSIITAGMTEGLLFEDIWRSSYTGNSIYPESCVFVIPQ